MKIIVIGGKTVVIARSPAEGRTTKQSGGMDKHYYVYIMTNPKNTVLYTDVTNDLKRRVYEHKNKLISGFTKKYNLTRLAYYEICEDVESAIAREKQIKGGSRADKLALVNVFSGDWHGPVW